MLVVADNLAEASKKAKESAFYKHTGFSGAPSHIDDKYGVDVDDAYAVTDILSDVVKTRYTLEILEASDLTDDELHLGYMPLYKN